MSDYESSSGYPIIAEQHEIDRRARALVTGWMAEHWLLRPLSGNDDYGLDYLVENIDGRHPGGRVFFVQLKGSRQVTHDKTGRAGWSLDVRHLRYYAERIELPVFLFLVDVSAACGWFCFIQGELSNSDAEQKLASQKSATIHTKLSDRINDTPRLREAVDAAMLHMRARNPGSIEDAIAAVVRKHEAIDPRFAVRVDVINGGRVMSLAPKGKFSFGLTAKIDHAGQITRKLDSMFRYGRPVELTSDEVDFSDMPIVDHIVREGRRVHFAFTPAPAVDIEVLLRGGTGRETFDLKLEGKMSGGPEGAFVECSLKDCPLAIGLEVAKAILEKGGAGAHITTSWDPRGWIGRSLKTLAWLEPVTFFWRTLVSGQPVEAIFSQRGNRLSRGHIQADCPSESSRGIADFCDVLWKARELDIAHGWGLTVPESEDLWQFDWSDIDIAFDLHTTGRHQRTTPNLRMEFSHVGDEANDLREFQDGSERKGATRIAFRPYEIFAFGRKLTCGDATLELNPILWRRLPSTDGDGATSEVLAVPETLFVLTRTTD